MQYQVYVLFSPSYNKIYIGFTSDLETRIRSHNVLATKGWTVNFRPWELIYSENFSSKSEAMKREKELKSSRGMQFADDGNEIFRSGYKAARGVILVLP